MRQSAEAGLVSHMKEFGLTLRAVESQVEQLEPSSARSRGSGPCLQQLTGWHRGSQ